jgi:hypothetical protein
LIQARTLSGDTRYRLATSATVKPAAASGDIPRLLSRAQAGARQQDGLNRFQITEELAIGPQTGYAPGLGLCPQPTEGHAEPSRRDVEGDKLGIARCHAPIGADRGPTQQERKR